MQKILIVEDDPMISEIYQKKFSVSGFEVDIAMSGTEALKKTEENQYDLVLLDLVLPEMNGIEILKEIRSRHARGKDVRVAIFSNLNDQENQARAMKLGVVGFIEKSQYNPSELVSEVERLMRTSSEQQKNAERLVESADQNISSEKKSAGNILFIEDEDIFLELFGSKLRDEGFRITEAKTGSEGLEKAAENDYDLIVTDMLMPAMRGDEIIAQMRKSKKVQNTPIIVLSASATDEEIARVKKLDVQGFFMKTQTTPSDLARHIKKVIVDAKSPS